jgi:mRNA interferase RelE/StbE
VSILPSARRQLLRLRGAALDQVRRAIRQLADDPTPGDSLAMVGKARGLHRLRVGSHRVVYRIQDDELVVLVIRIGHRSDIYRGFQER